MVKQLLGSCGETSERTAARIHSWASVVMFLLTAIEFSAVLLHVVMGTWHAGSVKTHNKRAEDRGE